MLGISMASMDLCYDHNEPRRLTSYEDTKMLQTASQRRVELFLPLFLMVRVYRILRLLCSSSSISAASIAISNSARDDTSTLESLMRTKR